MMTEVILRYKENICKTWDNLSRIKIKYSLTKENM